LFLNILSLRSLSVRDQVSHPYKTTSNVIVLIILICRFSERRRKDERFWMWAISPHVPGW
jgi:hypothetical protein